MATDYQLVTSASDLEAGAHYVIGASYNAKFYVMSTADYGNNRKVVEATMADGVITGADDILTLTLGGVADAWTFATDNYLGTAGYLNTTNTTGSNYLKVVADLDDYAYFTIAIEDGVTTVSCNGKTTRHILYFNGGSSCFACYNNQTGAQYVKPSLFKEVQEGPKTSWTVAGSSEVAFGTTWAPANKANDMIKQEDGSYKWEKTELELAAGSILFKVCKDHAWTEAYPAENYELAIAEGGIYTITITFEPENENKVSAVATKTGEAVVLPTVVLHGNFTGEWKDTDPFAPAEDKLTARLNLTLAEGNYEFGFKFDGAWKANGATITREAPSTSLAEGSGNMHFVADVAGEYELTYTFETQTLDVVYPKKVDPNQMYVWNGNGVTKAEDAIELGGAAEAVQADGTNIEVGVKQKGNWCLKANKGFNSGAYYLGIAMDNAVNAGDTVKIAYFRTSSKSTYVLGLDFSADKASAATTYQILTEGDPELLESDGIPADVNFIVPEGVSNAKYLRIYRNTGGTGLWVSKVEVVKAGDTPTPPTPPTPVTLPVVALAGGMNGWSADANILVAAEDSLSASVKVALEAGDVEFKIVSDGKWLSLNGEEPDGLYTFHRDWTTASHVNVIDGRNFKLTADVAGDYIFTWTYADSTLAITFPEKPVDPQPVVESVVYNWAKAEAEQVGTTFFGNSDETVSTVKIHSNTDDVDCIKFGKSYVYADGKYIAIKPAEGAFKAGDTLKVAVVFNNSDATKYCMVDVFAADGESRLWRTDSATTVNGRTSAADPAIQTYVLAADQDSLLLGRYGNTGMCVTFLQVVRPAEEPIEPTITCAAVYELADDAEAKLNDVTVTYVNGKNVWVKDASGSMLVYLTANATWAAGDVLTGVVGTKATYKGLVEVKPSAEQVEAVVATPGEAPAPEELAEVKDADMNKYVILKGVAAEGAFVEGTASNLNITLGENTYVLRNFMKNAYTFEAGKSYDVTALVSIYNTLQLYFVSATESAAPADPTAAVAGTMSDWNQIPFQLSEDKKKATLYNDNIKAGTYEFKMIINGEWRSNGYEYHRDFPGAAGITGNADNMKVTIDVEGAYTFEWYFENDSLAIIFPEKPAPVLTDGYYLMGSFNDWKIVAENLFQNNIDAEGEYVLDINLTEGDEIKVAYVEADEATAWFPKGENYIVDKNHSGATIMYFRPEYNEEWSAFGGYFYIVPTSTEGIEETLSEGKAVKVLREGNILILKGDKTYTVMGQIVK